MAEFAIIKKSTLVNIANAIREMQGLPTDESEDGYVLIPTANMADEIRAIETGTDLSATTLTSGAQLLSPLTAYDAEGNLITGTIPTKTQNDLTVSGAQVKVPAGYYETLVTKSVATTGLGTPTIAVDATGNITATVTHTASGYVEADAKSATKQLTTQAAVTITPGTSSKTAVASGRYTTGEVKVAGDSNLVASNIKSGVSIFGVTGTYVPVFA